MKIEVTPEGRPNIYVPYRDSLIEWITAQEFEVIHNFMVGGIMLGADHDPEGVIDDIKKADEVAITVGDMWRQNLKHALSVIANNKLELFDIGEITDADLKIHGNTSNE
jgi:hypothetical protein